MSESECEFYQPQSTEQKSKSTRKVVDKKRKAGSPPTATPTSKKPSVSDIFGLNENRESASTVDNEGLETLSSFFVNRVGNGYEQRYAVTTGSYYVDCKVYKSEDARTIDSKDHWKKALVRIKFQTNADSIQWQKLQKFVQSTDSLFLDPPKFYK